MPWTSRTYPEQYKTVDECNRVVSSTNVVGRTGISLRNRFLNNNKLTGSLENLTTLTKLKALSVSPPRTRASQPENSRLSFRRIGDNRLGGSIPDSLAHLTNLIVLCVLLLLNGIYGNNSHQKFRDLKISQLVGCIPESMGNLVRLQRL